MRRIMYYVKPYIGGMLIGLVIKVLATLCELFLPRALAYIVDEVIPRRSVGQVLAWGGVMLLASLLAWRGNIVANRRASKVARDATESIRLDLFTKISYLSSRQAEGFTMPSLISRATTDTYNIHQMLGMMQRLGVRAPIMLLGGVIITLTMDPVLTLTLVAMMPFIAVMIWQVTKRGVPMYRKVQEAADRFVRQVREAVTGIRVIKALSRTEYEKKKFAAINEEVVVKDQKAGMVMSLMNPLMNLLLNLGLVLVILIGAWRVNEGLSSPGTIIAFLSYVTLILNAILFLSRMFMIYSKASASAARVTEILDAPEDLTRQETAEDGRSCGNSRQDGNLPQIVFDHVSFSYSGGSPDVWEICFELEKGETLGIIGGTGAGKSTLIQLMMRFYDVTEGRILLEGKDIRSWDKQELRKKFGAAFQNDVIFEDSIAENISFGRNLSREEILEAVHLAQADTFVQEKGLDAKLAIKGADLSGGQKQRLLIARALAGKPDILVLDDSSSALDYRTDARLRQAIAGHFSETTKIIVAQRVSSILNADLILVMDGGRVIAKGRHEELLKNCEIYREISRSQMEVSE